MNDYRELIPEFFYEPEFLSNHNGFDLGKVDGRSISEVILPPWASTSMEFVYMHRKALESEYVGRNLNFWIDFIFGAQQKDDQNQYREELYEDIWSHLPSIDRMRRLEIETITDQVGQVPPRLFNGPHPRRIATEVDPSLEQPAAVNLDPGSYAFAMLVQDCSCKLLVLDEEMSPTIVNISFKDPMEVTFAQHSPAVPLPKDLSEFLPLHQKDKFACLANDRLEAIIIDPGADFQVKQISASRQRITAFSSGAGIVAISSDDGRTHIYTHNKVLSIPTYRSSVVCSSVSANFGIIVMCCDGGSVVIGSLHDGSIIRVLQVDMVPENVLVTPAWGFILVNGYVMQKGKKVYSLSIFNVNGLPIRKVSSVAVEKWVAWSNGRHFDFVLMCGDGGRLFVFEAFYGEIGEAVGRCAGKLVGLEYCAAEQLILGVSEEGKVYLIPFMTKSIEKYL
jgi:hypothetical protein